MIDWVPAYAGMTDVVVFSYPWGNDRFVIPAAHREQAIEMMEFTGDKQGAAGFGFKEGTAQRGP